MSENLDLVCSIRDGKVTRLICTSTATAPSPTSAWRDKRKAMGLE
jgi:hypothetical protein